MESEILIIGAGASGIAAATKLVKSGYRNVTILEAENYYGGRIKTVPFGVNVVDLGAQWCHGEKDNVVFEMAKPLNLLDSSGDSCHYNIKSNKEIVPQKISEKVSEIINSLLADENIKHFDGSLGSYLDRKFYAIVNKSEYSDDDRKTMKQLYEFFQKMQSSIEASDSLYEVSAKEFYMYKECEGDQLLNWKDKGYVTIINTLMENVNGDHGILKDKIKLNKTVQEIEWDHVQIGETPKIRVKCKDGEEFLVDHVICTISLGVLKERFSHLFRPSLPIEKVIAIEGLSIGTVNKIFLEFPESFWTEEWYGFGLIWEEEQLKEIRNGPYAWLENVIAFFPLPYQPQVLCGWIIGDRAREIETFSEDEVIEGCMLLLKKFLDWQIPHPIKCVRSKWHSNPNFRGSYSFRSLRSTRMNALPKDLAKPILSKNSDRPLLLFAGEATHDHFFSTVHGAIESGWREALRITSYYGSCSIPKGKVCAGTELYDVIVIGAGLAGLGAGYALKKTNLNFLILEGQNYIGGRVLTEKMYSTKKDSDQNEKNDFIIDAGAQWLHGQQNELYKIAANCDLLTTELSEEGLGCYIRDDGYEFDEYFVKRIDFEIGKILEECENLVNTFEERKTSEYPKSLGEFLTKKFRKYSETLAENERKEALQLFDWHKRFQIIDNSCLDLNELSAKYWGLYSFNGESCQAHINFKNGFSSLINKIVEIIGENKISKNTKVTSIEWDAMLNTQNICRVYTNENRNYLAKSVICTFSVGVLKSVLKKAHFFNPPLPKRLCQVLNDLGFSTINKIFLQFEYPWWNDLKGFQFIYRENNNYENLKWTRFLSGFDVLSPGSPNTLIGWVGSYGALEMEKLSDTVIINDCLDLLEQFTGREISYPIRFYCTRWGSNEFIQGSYSYISTKCDKTGNIGKNLSEIVTVKDLQRDEIELNEDFENILNLNNHYDDKNIRSEEGTKSQPLLCFAGEACHEKYFSTAHGAFISGYEQARKVINHFIQ